MPDSLSVLRPVVALCALTLLYMAGCNKSSSIKDATLDTSEAMTASSGVSEEEPGCVTPFMPVDEAMCAEQSSDYGLTPENPAEWGFGAGTRTLWFGRMMCEDGSMPEISRRGNIGKAPNPSSSPEGPSEMGALDILDLWEVQCPGEPVLEVYHNMYRCGSPCPPAGTKLIPAQAYSDYIASYQAHEEGDPDLALSKAQSAHAASPRFEILSLWLAILSQEAGHFEEALTLYDEVLAIKPDDTYSKIKKAIVLNTLGRPTEALAITTPLVGSIPPDDPAHGNALCAHATALLPTSPDDARHYATQACAAGVQSCC